MKRAREPRPRRVTSYCRWVDVVGRDPKQLERVRQRLALPARLVGLSLADYLYPLVVSVWPVWFLATYFTTPSRYGVFARQPLYLWRAPYALVTISPWARRGGGLAVAGHRDETRDDFLCRMLEATTQSHEEVIQQFNEAFFAHDTGFNASAWHYKEQRVTRFADLLTHELDFLRAVGLGHERVLRVHEQLAGLVRIVRYAEDQLRQSGHCEVCRSHGVIDRPRREEVAEESQRYGEPSPPVR